MLGSISPVGEASRQQRWWLTATAYTVASITGGALIGLVLGSAGAAVAAVVRLDLPVRLIALGAVAVAGALVDARAVPWGLPTWHRQVDERWLTTYRGWIYGAGFGFQLGTGIATIVTSAATYATLAAAFLSTSAQGGLVVGTAFGAVRSVPLLLAGRLRTPGALHRTTQRVEAAEPLVRRVAVVGQAMVAALALVAAGTLA